MNQTLTEYYSLFNSTISAIRKHTDIIWITQRKKFKNCYLLKNQNLRIKKLLNRRPLQEN